MSPSQFDALAQLMRLRARSASAQALRMVLVDGIDPKTAAEACMIQVGHVDVVLESAKKAVERAQALCAVSIP